MFQRCASMSGVYGRSLIDDAPIWGNAECYGAERGADLTISANPHPGNRLANDAPASGLALTGSNYRSPNHQDDKPADKQRCSGNDCVLAHHCFASMTSFGVSHVSFVLNL
jgi:hypothetical protein